MSNRVEELETTVSALESTIEGLTEELVETKERLRVIESKLDVDAADVVQETPIREAPAEDGPTTEAAPDEVEQAVEADKEAESEEPAETEGTGELGDDIIVA
ncbi:hypothetical protein L593_02245 [Salinarchaeum sp. Harcht-Bsk1]|uniref:DUF7518 family protein n=1 Tax=Salinarchaeum sp. Harcht-Bsk1 TaxID=1333523 RepID=UPI0003422D8D|nr:hypothetical protein [Salinarchaeum sp. Harcht-Bsk1]AGN00400.1 hypothetical protein L593_02245 [Salinarchaeum sp. Harcht-Bsk1]